MNRPLISFILLVVVAIVALIASGMVEIVIDVRDQDGNPVKRKKDNYNDIDEISEAEVVDDDEE